MTRDTLRQALIVFRSTRNPIVAAVRLNELLDAYNPVVPPTPKRSKKGTQK